MRTLTHDAARSKCSRIARRCREEGSHGDEKCRAAFPGLQQDFDKVIAALSEKPASFNLEGETIVLTHDAFTERLRLMLYDLPSASRIPSMIHQAARDNLLRDPQTAWTPHVSRRFADLTSRGKGLSPTRRKVFPATSISG